MSSFPDFSGITQLESSQQCGAYALAAALNQLRFYRQNIPLNPVYLFKIDTNNPLNGYTAGESITVRSQPEPAELADTVYGVTGCLNLEYGQATYVNDPDIYATQNPASALIYVAKKFGVQSIAVTYTESLRNRFQQIEVTNLNPVSNDLFMVEERIIKSLGCQPRLLTNSEYLYPTKANEVDIVLVNGGTHWVAITWEGIVSPDILFVSGHKPAAVLPARNTGALGRVARANSILEDMATPVAMQGNRKKYDPASGDIGVWEYDSNFSTGCWIRLTR